MIGWLDGWMVGWLDGWMVGWLDGWMVGWLDECLVDRNKNPDKKKALFLRPFL
jgi:organic anion transporter 5A